MDVLVLQLQYTGLFLVFDFCDGLFQRCYFGIFDG